MADLHTRVYADFHNADPQGRVRLNAIGTQEDLARQAIELQNGMRLKLYCDDVDAQGRLDELLVDAVVSYSDDEQCWVASIDWSAVHHASDNRLVPRLNSPSFPPSGVINK